jgi:hypothetical protein
MSDDDLLSYLFVIDSTQLPLSEALKTIDQLPEIENWQTVLPDAAVLVSRLSIQKLDELIRSRLAGQRYLLTLLERGKKAGWLAKRSWTFMNEPVSLLERAGHRAIMSRDAAQ